MRGTFSLFVALLVNAGLLQPIALAQKTAVPEDGAFHVVRTPAYKFTATLNESWTNPRVGDGHFNVYFPVAPQLPSQEINLTRLLVTNHSDKATKEVTEVGSNRKLLRLVLNSSEVSPKNGLSLQAQIEGTLYSRTLKPGKSPRPVPELTPAERGQYLKASETMDFQNPSFVEWMTKSDLKRQPEEGAMQFAHRIFTRLIRECKVGGDTASYESRRPSRVCKTLANDCGGLALLFTGVMRSNGIPARTLFGRWAIPQSDAYGQYHVIAEFFVNHSGWVPVDVSGTIAHQPRDPYAFFGSTDGQHIAFHVDTDLIIAPDFRHAWSQYMLLHWVGGGDFWKDHRTESRWNVVRVSPQSQR
jgi:hypothetical protein